MTAAEQRHEAQQLLNDLLKKSDYLKSIIDSHRVATAETIAFLINAMVKHDPTLSTVVAAALSHISSNTLCNPSVAGDRSLLASSIRAQISISDFSAKSSGQM